MPKILQILRNPGSRIRMGFCRFSWGSNHFIKEISCNIKHYNMDNKVRRHDSFFLKFLGASVVIWC